jgi:hypothetical protein
LSKSGSIGSAGNKVVKRCKWRGFFCCFESCSYVDASGNVVLCRWHGNPRGYRKSRLSKPVSDPIFSKHALRRSR